MKKNLVLLVVAIILVASLVVINKLPRSQNSLVNDTIKIGAILPLTGDFAQFGEAINQGAQLAAAEAVQQGIDVQYISEDDQSSAAGAVNAANKLVRVDKVNGVLTATVQEVKPVVTIFKGSNIPLLATWDSNNYIKNAGPNIFTIGFSTEDAGKKMARYAYDNLKLRRVAVVSQIDEWSELIGQAFQNEFKALGGEVLLSEQLQASQKDFRNIISKVKIANVEGIYFPFLPNTIAPFAVQAKQLGFKGILMTGDSFSLSEAEQAKGAAENLYFTNLYADNVQQLIKNYQTSYGKEPADPVFFSFGYDGMRTLITATQLARNNNVTVSEALRAVNMPGADYHIRFNGKQYSEKYERLYQVKNNELLEVK